MTFNDNSNIGGNKVRRRGRTTGIAVGGGGIGVIALFLISSFLGVDLTGLAGGQGGTGAAPEDTPLVGCETGADANESVDCRVGGAYASLDVFWAENAASVNADYHSPEAFLFDQSTTTGCGNATSATGPFYCPPDESIYIDTSFYDELRSRFGATGGPLAELYVVAHEWGHHIQNLNGSFANADRSDTGPGSDTIRLEVQADCFAGAWVAGASTTKDASGVAFLQAPTEAQIADALDAASVIGDDRIQESAGVEVQPETWTHGSSEQRQRWFLTGLQGGPTACDTFAAGADL